MKNRAPLQAGDTTFPEAKGFNSFSVDQEVQIGKQAAAEADAQLPELPARGPISDYVSTLGQKLARQLPENKYEFNFKVINQKEINAFALPGGPIRLNLGTLQAADNEAELAGVLAHEISHVYLRHATRNASKAQIAQIPAAILGGILGNGAGGQLARMGLEFGLGSVFMKYSRDAESEADYLGAKIMYEAGYDPQAMVAFFRKLEEMDKGSGGPQFLSDHPNPGNRAEAVTGAISQLPAKRFVTQSNEFRTAKVAAAKLKPFTGEEIARQQQQKQAKIDQVSRSSIQPSGSFQRLDHSVFQMQYPSNWEVFGDRNSAVTIAPRAGVGTNAIAYGVVVSAFQPQQQQALEQSTQQIYQGLQQSNPQIQPAGRLERVNVNGMEGRAINLASPSPLSSSDGSPVTERDMLVTVQRNDGSVLWMLFIAPERDFEALSPTYRQMINSLQVR